MIKVVTANKPVEKTQSTWEGKTSDRWLQWFLLEVDGLPMAFSVSHISERDVLPAGEYEFSARSFSVERGRLTLKNPVLIPVVTQAKGARPVAAAG